MSLSKFYKGQGDFVPERLVPRSPKDTENWKPVTISEDSLEDHFSDPPSRPVQSTNNSITPNNDLTSAEDATVTESEDHSAPAPEQEREEQIPSPPLPDLDKLQEDAFIAGVAEGLKQSENDFGSGTKALTQACELLSNIRETILKNSKGEMIDLVIALSEKIIRHSITEQNQTILDTVEEAIHQAVKSSEFYIYLHPDDIAIIQERTQDLVSRVNGLDNIVVKTDSSVEQGGCKIESDNCTVDATLVSQLEIIQKRIKE